MSHASVSHLRSDYHQRWLTSREALLCQGFPILKSFSEGAALCSFALDGYENDVPDLDTQSGKSQACDLDADGDRASRIGQAGNAMHTECVGIMLAYALTRGNTSVSDLKQTHQLGKLLPDVSHANIAHDVRVVAADRSGARPQPRQPTQVCHLSGSLSSLLSMAAMIAGQRSTNSKSK